jgi:Protein of unknown function (DUF1003)
LAKRPPSALSSSPSTRRNIEAILQLEKEDEEALAPHHRIFHAIGWFVGTVYFIIFQCAGVGLWIAFNSMSASHPWAIDDYPFPLLATLLSLEPSSSPHAFSYVKMRSVAPPNGAITLSCKSIYLLKKSRPDRSRYCNVSQNI